MALTSCSTGYARYMGSGCNGLRDSYAAFQAGDEKAFSGALRLTGNFDPAGEDATGDPTKVQEVAAAWNARRTLNLAAYVGQAGDEVWHPSALTAAEQQLVAAGLATCVRY